MTLLTEYTVHVDVVYMYCILCQESHTVIAANLNSYHKNNVQQIINLSLVQHYNTCTCTYCTSHTVHVSAKCQYTTVHVYIHVCSLP